MASNSLNAANAVPAELSPNGIRQLMNEFFKPALEQAMTAFGNCIAADLQKLEERIARSERCEEAKAKARRQETTIEQLTGKALLVNSEVAPVQEAASCNEKRGETKTAARRRRRKNLVQRCKIDRDELLHRRGGISTTQVDNELSVQQRLHNLEAVVVTVALNACHEENTATPMLQSTEAAYCSTNELAPEEWGPWQSAIEWGPWQGATPAAKLAEQCSAARRLQRWWRRVRSEVEVNADDQSEWDAGHPPLAFLTVRDIAQLQAVSFHHTTTLWSLGYGYGPESEQQMLDRSEDSDSGDTEGSWEDSSSG